MPAEEAGDAYKDIEAVVEATELQDFHGEWRCLFLWGKLENRADWLIYSYKQLTSSNVPDFKDLLKVFGEAFEEPATYQGNVPSDAYLKSLLAKDYFIALVALDGENVVGGLAAYVLEKFEQERKEIYIYDLAVSESHRRHGIATGLINNLKMIARDIGAYVIFVQADKGDTAAISLYESLGKAEDTFNFDINVQ